MPDGAETSRSITADQRFGPMILRSTTKVALVIGAGVDDQSQPQPNESSLINQLHRAQWQVWMADDEQQHHHTAVDLFNAHSPHLVIIDARQSTARAIAVSQCLHTQCIDASDTLFAALLEKWPSKKTMQRLIDADIAHIIRIGRLSTSLFDAFWRLQERVRTVRGLFAALEIVDIPVQICDNNKCVQYVNKAYELVTGCPRTDILGSICVLTMTDLNRRKSAPDQHSNRYATPPLTTPTAIDKRTSVTQSLQEDAATSGGASTGTATIDEAAQCTTDWQYITVPCSSSQSQHVHVKKPRDGRLHDLSLHSVRSQVALVDAPISEVLHLLREVAQRCSADPHVQQLIKESVRVLAQSELYAPSITRFRDNDRIATGYYDGLVRCGSALNYFGFQLHHHFRSRRKSLIDAMRESRQSSASAPSVITDQRRVSADVKVLLERDSEWDFDILELERLADRQRVLTQIGMRLFDKWKLCEVLGCTEPTLHRWLLTIEANYHPSNPYHNATHAADVLQATAHFLDVEKIATSVEQVHACAALIAAAVHDLDHPGKGNAYLINTRHSLAILYNDMSVLENHHVSFAFRLTLQPQSTINIFESMARDEFSVLRQAVVEMVLATDMRRHFEYLTKFQQTLLNNQEGRLDREQTSMTICRMLIKCADIANPTRTWHLCQQWAYRIVDEYFQQTDDERDKGLPLSMEVFDRETCNVPLTQCGFVDMFAREMFSWAEFANMPQLLEQLESNYERWRNDTVTWDPSRNNITPIFI